MTEENSFEEKFKEFSLLISRFVEIGVLKVKIAEFISSQSAEISAYLLEKLIEKASSGDIAARKALCCIIDSSFFSKMLGEGKLTLIYSFSLDKGFKNVERLLRRYKNKDMPAGDGDNPFIPELEEMSLGEKKFRARTGDFNQLDKFAHDLSPEVIENLLKNPRITERVVIKIASRRPSNPRVLEKIFKNAKWISRYSIKKALIFNPYTPVNIAIGLVSFMMKQDIEEILKTPHLHPEIKKRCVEILEGVKGSVKTSEV